MRRRNLLRGAVLAPAAVALPAAIPAAAAPQYAAPSTEPTGAKVVVNAPSLVGEQRSAFFDAMELSALRALANTLVPAFNGMPGAVEAGVPEFFDFVIGESPAARQQLWRSGLHELDAQSLKVFGVRFDKLTTEQTGKILEPLKAKWTFYGPPDPFGKFLWEARAEMLQATLNSREYAESNSGRRAAAASNYYWRSLD
ncbi:MAG: gluconate 2-dehydrogenase subunit 3 family protein [Acidobacteriota bacterium]